MCHNSTVEGIADQVIRLPLRSTHRIKLGGRQWLFGDQRRIDVTVSDAEPAMGEVADPINSEDAVAAFTIPELRVPQARSQILGSKVLVDVLQRQLTDPRRLHLAIIDIVLAAGFGDVSHFNRVFRRRFGDTLSGVRAAAIRPKQK
jgi:hypothetical protein